MKKREKWTMAQALKLAREEKGLSLRGLAKLSEVSLSTLSKLETGTLDNPTLSTMRKLGEALDIEPKEWFYGFFAS